MGKAMTIAGMIVAAFVFFLFLLDIFVGFPFGTGMNAMHIGALIASAILGYVSFSTFREQK
jgi:membrane associated rhomboid family serine protease